MYDGKPHNSLFQTRFGDEPCRAAQESHDFNRGRCQEFYKSNGDGTEPYKVEIGDDMEKFISEELCGNDTYYIKTNNFSNYHNGLALVSVFFVHKKLYDILIREIGDRVPYNQSECYRDLLRKKFE